jgi:hypothetical protein
LNRAAAAALRHHPDVRLTEADPDLTLVLDPAWTDGAPGTRHIAFPWGLDVGEPVGTVWAPSRWHQRHLPGAPRVPLGAWIHQPRPAPPDDGGIVLLVLPADAPVPHDVLETLGEGVYPVREAPGADDVPCLPYDTAQRAAIWYQAAAVVLMPGCASSLPLAVEARSAGVPVLVPKGDPADELMMVNGIGAYGVQLGDPPYPDLAALSLRLGRMAGNGFAVRDVDLSQWAWDGWAESLVTCAKSHLASAPASGTSDGEPMGMRIPAPGADAEQAGVTTYAGPTRHALFSLTPVTGNVTTEGLLARLLRAQGQEPVLVRCNGLRQRCTLDLINPTFGSRTAICFCCVLASAGHLHAWAGGALPEVLLDDLVDARSLQAAETTLAQVPDADLFDFTFDGMPLGCWIEHALRIEYFGESWRSLPDLHAKARIWLQSCLPIAIATDTYLSTTDLATVIVLSGIMPWERIVRARAERHGVRCIFYEGGQRPGSLILTEGKQASDYDFSEDWQAWKAIPLSVAEARRLDDYLGRRRNNDGLTYGVYSPAATGEVNRLREALRLAPGRPVIVAFSGLTVDATIMAAYDAFASQADWLDACIRYAADHPEVDLVIRVHPVEATTVRVAGATNELAHDRALEVIQDRWPGLPPNVRLVPSEDETSSYDLLQLATVVLTFISTLGCEAAAAGIPVITSGRSHYRDLDFVWPVRAAADLPQQLDRVLDAPRQPDHARELARRYLYFWFFRCTPLFPGLPTTATGILTVPNGPLPYWDKPGSPLGLAAYVRYLAGAGPFVAPPLVDRHRDGAGPQPIQAPAAPVVLVCPAGWKAEALAAVMARSHAEQPATRFHVLFGHDDWLGVARGLASALTKQPAVAAAITVHPAPSAEAEQLAWWHVAVGVIPPQQEAQPVLDLAEAFGVPLWPLDDERTDA